MSRSLIEWVFRPAMGNPEKYNILPEGFGQIEEPHVTNLANLTRLLRHISSYKPFANDSAVAGSPQYRHRAAKAPSFEHGDSDESASRHES